MRNAMVTRGMPNAVVTSQTDLAYRGHWAMLVPAIEWQSKKISLCRPHAVAASCCSCLSQSAWMVARNQSIVEWYHLCNHSHKPYAMVIGHGHLAYGWHPAKLVWAMESWNKKLFGDMQSAVADRSVIDFMPFVLLQANTVSKIQSLHPDNCLLLGKCNAMVDHPPHLLHIPSQAKSVQGIE